jgi:hypothetical protein
MLTLKTLNQVLANVPDYKVFHTVAEMDEHSKKLSTENPDLVSIFEIGKTRKGHPLYCLKIGSGSKNALLMGCPHPNEPIGAMMLEFFSEELVRNADLRAELDFTWYVIKSWDADGTMRNEGWFKGPFTLYHYARNFYRPPGNQQVDWTFPVDHKNLHWHTPIPETQAVMDLISQIKPVFNYTLHNAGFGGVYFYISRSSEEIYEPLRGAAAKQAIPLHLGEPEAPYIVPFSPAIYPMLGIAQGYDYMEKFGIEHPETILDSGTNSADFAEKQCGTYTLLTELPYFYDKRINDLSPSDITRRDAILQKIEASEQANVFIQGTLDSVKEFLAADNPFKQALDAFLKYEGENEAMRKMVNEDPEYGRLATVAEKFDNLLISRFYKSLSLGLLVRASESALEQMQDTGKADPQKEAALKEAQRCSEIELKTLTDYLEEQIQYEVVPIQKLICIQLEAGLITADYLLR